MLGLGSPTIKSSSSILHYCFSQPLTILPSPKSPFSTCFLIHNTYHQHSTNSYKHKPMCSYHYFHAINTQNIKDKCRKHTLIYVIQLMWTAFTVRENFYISSDKVFNVPYRKQKIICILKYIHQTELLHTVRASFPALLMKSVLFAYELKLIGSR